MKFLCLSLLVFFGIAEGIRAQQVTIQLKDGTTRKERIKANSDVQVWVVGGSISYAAMESVKFDKDSYRDPRLLQRLSTAGVRIYVEQEEVKIHVDRIDEQPERGDKSIVLVCADSTDFLYKRIGQHLALKGYAIENTSRDLLTIKTALRRTSKRNCNYFLNVVVLGNQVVITANWGRNDDIDPDVSVSGFFDWEFTDKQGVNSVLYNDLMKNLQSFDRLRTEFK